MKQDQLWRNMQHQFQQIQPHVFEIQGGRDQRGSQPTPTAASPVPTGDGTSSGRIEPRLHPRDETRDDDIEQFMQMISPDMAVSIKEHDPATAEEAARLAETYLATRRDAALEVEVKDDQVSLGVRVVMPNIK